ncbi:tripartite tricarboxylate transporter substrate binding protein [Variovorax sp. KK3]|uniref:Bug family tripartite tricarboxylate transporter substrate binding protein n=1 Tax=Variovorax sp. KK3 TaxID=1855728 RepID=UPI0021180863|nr:tripartite tricarboxylate transporter substrate binding protein [Variovorax sp. KK3]
MTTSIHTPARPAVPSRRSVLAAALLGAAGVMLASAPFAVRADTYPSKPIRLLVPTGTGTVSDMVGRLLATHLSKTLGQGIVVENIPAAGGINGTQQLVRSAKDGYTIAVLNNNHVINPSIYKDIPYDSLKDIQPISVIGSTPLVLVTNPGVPAKTLGELLSLARSKPGQLTYGSAGNGTVLHLAGVLLTSEGKVDIKHVPYKASGQMTTDVMGGQIDMVFLGVASAAAQIESGKIRAIGVTTTQRSPLMPNVPTLAESGLPNYNFDGWMALVGPAGLPRPVLDKLNSELKTVLALPEVQESLTKMAVLVKPDTPEQATVFFKNELQKHTDLAKRGGATLD